MQNKIATARTRSEKILHEKITHPLLKNPIVGPLLVALHTECYTVEPRYKDLRYNDIPGITIDMLCPGKSYSKMYGTEPRYNDLQIGRASCRERV